VSTTQENSTSGAAVPVAAPPIKAPPTTPLPPLKRYCITRKFDATERAYISAQNETHARVLAERHWGDKQALGAPVIPASETTTWQVREMAV
jgi:hypothetical protein